MSNWGLACFNVSINDADIDLDARVILQLSTAPLTTENVMVQSDDVAVAATSTAATTSGG